MMGNHWWASVYLHTSNIVDSSFVVFGGVVLRVEAPMTKHLRNFALDLKIYKAVQNLPM